MTRRIVLARPEQRAGEFEAHADQIGTLVEDAAEGLDRLLVAPLCRGQHARQERHLQRIGLDTSAQPLEDGPCLVPVTSQQRAARRLQTFGSILAERGRRCQPKDQQAGAAAQGHRPPTAPHDLPFPPAGLPCPACPLFATRTVTAIPHGPARDDKQHGSCQMHAVGPALTVFPTPSRAGRLCADSSLDALP
jgi:hypothetical protein